MSNLFLVEERNRLGLKAKEVAEYTGVSVQTQSNYEKGKRFPDSEYLKKIAEIGFDVNFVLSGQRNDMTLLPMERKLVTRYNLAPEAVQKHVLNSLSMYEDK